MAAAFRPSVDSSVLIVLWRLRQDAAKKFGKRFACGASVVKDASNKEEIDVQVRDQHFPNSCTHKGTAFLGAVVQGDFMEDIGDFILKEWPEITEDDVKYVDKK